MSTKETNLKSEIPLKGGSKNPVQSHGQTKFIHATQSTIHNPTLSLCMIVKDEEKFLPACLDSVRDYVDEIIIVDTGSTDRTVEIARKFNAKIYHHPWENSFSKARNYSLKYATCDWILILDADEEIEKEDAHKLKNVIKENSTDVIFIPVFSKFRSGKNTSIANSERIFKNHHGIHYEGVVHNSLKYSCPTRNENIRLYHHGYNLDEEQMGRKFTRTATLLREQIKNDPENPIPHHYLAISCLDRGMNDECIKEAQEGIRLFELKNANSQLRLLSYYTASVAFYRMKDLSNAERYALEAIELYPDYVDAYCLLSSIYFQNKEYGKCVEVTEKYLGLLKTIESDPNTALTIPFNTLSHARLAYSRLSIIYYEQGQEYEGSQALKDAVNSADEKWEPYLLIAKHFMEQKNFDLAERLLAGGLRDNPDNRDILYYTAEIYEKSGESDKALICFKKILNIYPDELPAQYNLGLLLLRGDQFDKAIKLFKSVTDKDPQHFSALFNMAIAYEGIGNITQAKDIYNNMIKTNPHNPEVLVRLGSLYLNESDYVKAKDCFLNTLNYEKCLIEAHLGLSKVHILMSDPESCVKSCDELLKYLNLPRNITINSIKDLSNLYINIGATLLKRQKEPLAGFSFEIAVLLDPDPLKDIQTETIKSVTTC